MGDVVTTPNSASRNAESKAPWAVHVYEGDRVFLAIGNYEFEIVVPVPSGVSRGAMVESTRNLLRDKMSEATHVHP